MNVSKKKFIVPKNKSRLYCTVFLARPKFVCGMEAPFFHPFASSFRNWLNTVE